MIDETKFNSMNENEKYKALAQEVAELATKNLSSVELVAMRQEFWMKYKFKVGDFKEVYNSERQKVLKRQKTNDENKKKEDIEQRLRNTKATLIDIHQGLRQVTSTTGDLIEIIMAVVISMRASEVNGLPMFWILIVDVPSGDKTSHLMMFEGNPFVICRDSITVGSFGSGYVHPETGEKIERDFLQELDGKCFICKDYSALFSGRPEKVQEFIGAMTNIYDQQFKRQTGTVGETGAEKCSFSHVAGITDLTLDKHHQYISTLGPRYFMFRQEPLSEEQKEKGFELLWGNFDVKGKKEGLKEMCSAYVFKLTERPDEFFKEVEMDAASKEYLQKLANLQSNLRGVYRRLDEGQYELQIEKPFRALQQLRTILVSLARIHGRKAVTDHEKELLRRVVLCSGPNDRVKVLSLYRNQELVKEGKLTVNTCIKGIGQSYNGTKMKIEELEALGILEKHNFNINDVLKGTDQHYWKPKEEFFNIITKPLQELDHIEDLKKDEPVA